MFRRTSILLVALMALFSCKLNEVQSPKAPPPLRSQEQQSRAKDVLGIAAYAPRITNMAGGIAQEQPFNTEEYGRIQENGFHRPQQDPLSTFSIDVDRASYANVRRFLTGGQRPPRDAVRVEELINYFTYDYPVPRPGQPFSISTELAGCPWDATHQLLLIGLQGQKIDTAKLPPANLVFLLDVSGSMESPDKLPLVKQAMRLVVEQLRPQDRVAIAVYAGNAGLVLPSTDGTQKATILAAIDQLEAGGSTAGGEGIKLAYKVAKENFRAGGNNRVILATDGDFNVGVSSDGELEQLIEEKRGDGIFLTVLGFGTGNIKDSKMELLADKGNGNYSYIDTLNEAKKVLVSELGGTLFTIAKDVKIQVEFNPAKVNAYRLIGYENRLLRSEDFNDDRKDAGELGSGHTVTALYEIVPAGVEPPKQSVDPLKYQATPAAANASSELATVKLRYKAPEGDESRLLSQTVSAEPQRSMSPNLMLASSVAEFGMLLRGSEHRGAATYEQARKLAGDSIRGRDDTLRSDFIALVDKAQQLGTADNKKIAEPQG